MSRDDRTSQSEPRQVETAALAVRCPATQLFVCCHCKQVPCQPVLLDCLHSCCRGCLDAAGTVAKAAGDVLLSICCPVCEETTAGDRRAKENAFATARLTAEGALRAALDYCDVCAEERQPPPATRWCEQCETTMCDNCLLWHDKFSKGHHVVAYAADSAANASEQLQQHWQRRKLLIAYQLHPVPCLPHHDAVDRGSIGGDGCCVSFCVGCERPLCAACAGHCSSASSHQVDRLGGQIAEECARQVGASVAQARDALASRRAALLLRRRRDELLLAQIEAARARDSELLQQRRQAVIDAVANVCTEAARDLDAGYRSIVAEAERARCEALSLDGKAEQAIAYADALLEPVMGSGSCGGEAAKYVLDQQAKVQLRLRALGAAADRLPLCDAADASDFSLLNGYRDGVDVGLVRSWIGRVDISLGDSLTRLRGQGAVDRTASAPSPRWHAEVASQTVTTQQNNAGKPYPTVAVLPLQRPVNTGPAESAQPTTAADPPPQPLLSTMATPQQQQQQQTHRQQLPPQQQVSQEQQQLPQRQVSDHQVPRQQVSQQQVPQKQLQHQQPNNVISISNEPWQKQLVVKGKRDGSGNGSHVDGEARSGPQAVDFRGREMDVLCLQPASIDISLPPDCRDMACTLDGRLFVTALKNGLKQYEVATGRRLKTWHPPMGRDGSEGCVNAVSVLDDDRRLAVANINAELVTLLRRDANSDELHEERLIWLDFGPWGMAISGDHMALSAAHVVKKPCHGESNTFAVVSCQCSPGARLTLTSLANGKTLLDRKLEYDISCVALTENVVICASRYEPEYSNDVNLCYVDAYGYDGTRLWRHMSQELVADVCHVPTANVAYLAMPTAMAVRAINSTDGELLADVITGSQHHVMHPRALAMHRDSKRPALVVMSFSDVITVHPVLL